MRDAAKEVYAKMKVGSIAWVRPVPAKGDTVASFQAAHDSAQRLAEDGLHPVYLKAASRKRLSRLTIITVYQ